MSNKVEANKRNAVKRATRTKGLHSTPIYNDVSLPTIHKVALDAFCVHIYPYLYNSQYVRFTN